MNAPTSSPGSGIFMVRPESIGFSGFKVLTLELLPPDSLPLSEPLSDASSSAAALEVDISAKTK